jgi:hypothetical protein
MARNVGIRIGITPYFQIELQKKKQYSTFWSFHYLPDSLIFALKMTCPQCGILVQLLAIATVGVCALEEILLRSGNYPAGLYLFEEILSL